MIIDISKHRTWGNNAYFDNYEKRVIVGWLSPKPKIGDKFKVEMKFDHPGKYFKLFTVVKIKNYSDPPDMFFADVIDTGIILEKENQTLIFEIKSKCPICKKRLGRTFNKMIFHVEEKHKDIISK